MKIKFLLSTMLVLALSLAACAPKAAPPPKKLSEPTTRPPVTQPTTMPTNTVKSSATAQTKPTASAPTNAPAQGSASSPTAAPGNGSFALPTAGPAETNDIIVEDQAVKSGTVLVNMVDSLQAGWVAIFTDDNGQPGKLLGYVSVPAGTSSDLKVPVDASSVTGKMIAMLLVDAGKIGTFEYPGADVPVKNADANTNVMTAFNRVSVSQ